MAQTNGTATVQEATDALISALVKFKVAVMSDRAAAVAKDAASKQTVIAGLVRESWAAKPAISLGDSDSIAGYTPATTKVGDDNPVNRVKTYVVRMEWMDRSYNLCPAASNDIEIPSDIKSFSALHELAKKDADFYSPSWKGVIFFAHNKHGKLVTLGTEARLRSWIRGLADRSPARPPAVLWICEKPENGLGYMGDNVSAVAERYMEEIRKKMYGRDSEK